MPSPTRDPVELTQLLRSARHDPAAMDNIFSIVHEQLRRLASRALRGQRPGQTLQTTALVNESFLKLFGTTPRDFEDRHHFFLVAARAMRSIVVDSARARTREKRSSRGERISLDQIVGRRDSHPQQVCELDDALDHLATLDENLARLVSLRFFAGLSVAEIATVLNTPVRTVERQIHGAKALLRQHIG